jgi:hypothetical protein
VNEPQYYAIRAMLLLFIFAFVLAYSLPAFLCVDLFLIFLRGKIILYSEGRALTLNVCEKGAEDSIGTTEEGDKRRMENTT